MNLNKHALQWTLIFVCLAFPVMLFSQDAGYIEYLTGNVSVQHNGEIEDLDNSDFGESLYEYDVISTGTNGLVKIVLDGVGAKGTKLTIHENTVFTIESGAQREYPDTRLKILKGSIGLRVSKLLNGSALTVQTESAAMGVRGTEFNVVTGPDGSVLVVCAEGRVACTEKNGDELFAVPGTGVQNIPSEDAFVGENEMTELAVEKGREADFIETWTNTRKEIFRSGAQTFVKAYWKQWNTKRDKFNTAYKNLIKKSALIQQYGLKALDSGFQTERETAGEMAEVKLNVSPEIVKMRGILSSYEQVYYRLIELESYHSMGEGVVVLDKKTSSNDFFEDFNRKSREYESELAITRYLMRMYLYINRSVGNIGNESLFEEFFSDDPLGEGKPSGNPF